MELICIASGSQGNSYILKSTQGEMLALECGVRMTEVKKAIDFRTSDIAGALVSHRHGDHAKYVHDFTRCGITVYGPVDVFILPHHRNRPVQPGKGFKVGSFKVLPFELKHDVPCMGYLIEHEEAGRILFMTDTYYSEYTFPGLNHILIETNYSDDALGEAILEGRTHGSQKYRLLETHMELSVAEAFLKAQDLKGLKTLVLCHLSGANSDEQMFVDRMAALTGKPVYVANRGLEIDLGI